MRNKSRSPQMGCSIGNGFLDSGKAKGGQRAAPPLLSGPARCQTGCQDSFSQLSARKPAHCRSLAANEREIGHETAAMVV